MNTELVCDRRERFMVAYQPEEERAVGLRQSVGCRLQRRNSFTGCRRSDDTHGVTPGPSADLRSLVKYGER
jgi:hypothetical protein